MKKCSNHYWWWNFPTKWFKTCYTFGIRKPMLFFILCCIVFPIFNECPVGGKTQHEIKNNKKSKLHYFLLMNNTNDNNTNIGEIKHCVVMWLCGSGMVAISNSFHERAVWKRRERESLICGSCTKERLELERSHSNAAMMTMDDDNRC